MRTKTNPLNDLCATCKHTRSVHLGAESPGCDAWYPWPEYKGNDGMALHCNCDHWTFAVSPEAGVDWDTVKR